MAAQDQLAAQRMADVEQVILKAAADQGSSEEVLTLLDEQELTVMVQQKLITPGVIRDTPEEQMIRAGVTLGFAKMLKRLFPSPIAGASVGGLQPVEVRCALRFHRSSGAEASILTSDETSHLLQHGESSVVDFKEVQLAEGKVQWRNRDVAIAACGFANSPMGGVLICGIRDTNKDVVGIDPSGSENVIHHITQALLSCASPPIKHAISSTQVLDKQGVMKMVVVVDIPPAAELTEAGDPRAVYQRHGDQTVRMSGMPLEDLRQGWRTVLGRKSAGDVTPVPQAALRICLDRTKLEMFELGKLIDASEEAREQALCTMRLANKLPDGQVVMTVVGMLLLSKLPKWQVTYGCPCFGIQIQLFENDDPPGTYLHNYTSGIIQSVELQGTAVDLMDRTLECISLRANEQYAKRVVKDAQGRPVVRGVQHELYSPYALQELVINAIVHRIYREGTGKIIIRIRHRSLEFVVPGAFLPGITATNVGLQGVGSMPRNPTLASFLQVSSRFGEERMSIFEGHGLGVARARQVIEAAGGTLTYRSEAGIAVTVMVTAAPTSPAQVTPREGAALSSLYRVHGQGFVIDCRDQLGIKLY